MWKDFLRVETQNPRPPDSTKCGQITMEFSNVWWWVRLGDGPKHVEYSILTEIIKVYQLFFNSLLIKHYVLLMYLKFRVTNIYRNHLVFVRVNSCFVDTDGRTMVLSLLIKTVSGTLGVSDSINRSRSLWSSVIYKIVIQGMFFT